MRARGIDRAVSNVADALMEARRALGIGIACAGLILLVPAPATAKETHLFQETFGSASKPSFSIPAGLAIDPSTGDVLVIDLGNGTLNRFKPNGEADPFSALSSNVIDGHPGELDATPQGGILGNFGQADEVQVAVDNSGTVTDGDIYVTDSAHHVVDIFSASGAYLGQLSESSGGGFGETCGVTVDENGNVYIGDFSNQVHKYHPTANPPVKTDNVANFSTPVPCNVAAGSGSSAGSLFVDEIIGFGGEGHVLKLDAATGELKYVVSNATNMTISVDPETGHLYSATDATIKEYDAAGAAKAVQVSTIPLENEALGVAVNGVTGDVYAALSGVPLIQVFGPSVTLPDATTEPATGVMGGDAVLHGVVNAVGGPPATCVFEYVEGQAKGFEGASSVPCSPSGPFTGTSGVAVQAELTGLEEGVYRFRLVATNENGSSEGEALSFSVGGAATLPDGRVYEMVSPPEKGGEVFPAGTEVDALHGSCVKCVPGEERAKMPMQPTPDGNRIVYEGQAFEPGLGSEANEYLAGRNQISGWSTEGLMKPEYRTNSPDPGTQLGGYLAFSTDLSRSVIYQADPTLTVDAPAGYPNLYLGQPGAPLQALLTSPPPNRPPGMSSERLVLVFGGANAGGGGSAAFSHIAFEANDALTGATGVAPAAPSVGLTQHDLYEWVNGELQLVSVRPGNLEAAPNAVIGAGHVGEENPAAEGPIFDRAISADGSRIFWTDMTTGKLYVRIDGTETREIPDPGFFITADPDGTKVLLNDGHIYDLESNTVTDLTSGLGGFEGTLGAADDLSQVFFVDSEVLTGTEENANEEAAIPGAHNLYAWHAGETVFIGRLIERDNQIGAPPKIGAWKPSPSQRTAQVTPEGRFLAFMSAAQLTGYDNTRRDGEPCTGSANRCYEVFEYDAATNRLTCASCNPSGERPMEYSHLTLIDSAASSAEIFQQPKNLTADGRLIFESQDRLTAQDVNGLVQDVYQWEPSSLEGPANSTCTRSKGCVSLISSGHGASDSYFLNATPSGNDIFIVTRDHLLPQDKDDSTDVYDARVGGGGFTEGGRAPCSGEACRGAISVAPSDGSAGSASYVGPGNEHPRKHKKHRKHRKKRRGHGKNRGHKRHQGGAK